MTSRTKRGNRPANMKARIGIATAVLVGGGAIGVAAAAAGNGGGASSALPAGYTTFTHEGFSYNHHNGWTLNFHQNVSLGVALANALSQVRFSQARALATLEHAREVRAFEQAIHNRTTFAEQRGIVELATKQFVLVKSANGSLHLWWLNGTKFANVASSATGMAALTGSSSATVSALIHNNMTPATVTVAGSTRTLANFTAPVANATTVRVATGNTTVTVTITASTATVVAPTTSPVVTVVTTPVVRTTTPIFTTVNGLQRGDLALVAGVRVHGALMAQEVLFAAATGSSTTGTTTTPVNGTNTTVVNGQKTVSGTHT